MQEKSDIANNLSGKKLEIITVAYSLFLDKGYTATSMRDISESVGLTKAALYHHFSSKEVLMEGVLYRIQRYLRLEIFCIAYDEKLTPKNRLKIYIDTQKKILLHNKRSCFIGNMTLEIVPFNPDFAYVLKNIFDEWVESLGDIYAHRHSKKKARELAAQTVIEFEGAVMLGQLTPGDTKVLDDAIKRALARF